MAGTLTISTLNDSSGVLATQNGMSGIAKAWARWNASTGAVVMAASFNVSSVTYLSTGYFQINMTTAMPDANYAIVCTGSDSPTVGTIAVVDNATAPTTTTYRMYVTGSNRNYNSTAVFR